MVKPDSLTLSAAPVKGVRVELGEGLLQLPVAAAAPLGAA